MLIRQIARRITTPISRRANRARIGRSGTVTRLRAVLVNLAARFNGRRATAAEFLASIGADAEFVRRYGSVFGKTATKILRERGVEPKRNGLAVIVRHRHAALVEVNTYPVDVLAAAAKQYARTAPLLNGHS